ncbi:MAG: RluA family pseudouridine synthase [Aquificaceae bacterium]|nr:RluA family pseudouridine synthase [Aquificaceae bacterium]MDW8237025.1 RluA family pseudouridine synthase [Aquificaceae bacterium]
MELSFLVSKELSGLRLDQALSKVDSTSSRSYYQKLIELGMVSVEGQVIKKPSYKLVEGQKVVAIKLNLTEDLNAKPEEIEIEVLYEDEELLVVNKPCGMVVHPSPGHSKSTLVNALLYRSSLSSIGGLQRPGIVHRLDKNTSGIIVVAKSDFAHMSLAKQFKNREVKKSYLTLVSGLPRWEHKIINSPIARHKIDRKRFAINPEGKEAISEVWKIKTFERQNISFLRVRIYTGRTHQIRVHLSSIGHPVFGDELYGFKKSSFKKELIQLIGDCNMLHSEYLGFFHPRSGDFVEFKLPPSGAFLKLLRLLEQLQESNS